MWRLGMTTHRTLSAGRTAVVHDGRLAVLGSDGSVADVEVPFTGWGPSLAADADVLVGVAWTPTTLPQVVALDLSSGAASWRSVAAPDLPRLRRRGARVPQGGDAGRRLGGRAVFLRAGVRLRDSRRSSPHPAARDRLTSADAQRGQALTTSRPESGRGLEHDLEPHPLAARQGLDPPPIGKDLDEQQTAP